MSNIIYRNSAVATLFVIINSFDVWGQSLVPVEVGEQVPDVSIKNIINYTSSQTNFSKLKGKLVIIDFWGTSCTNCIEALPKFDEMQKQFKNEIQVLTVTDWGSKEEVNKIFNRYRKLKNSMLPVVLKSEELGLLFPHTMVSHVVWIDPNGVVKAITGTEYVNESNIRKILNGDKVNWSVKHDRLDFNYQIPLISYRSEFSSISPKYSSVFTPYAEGIDSRNAVVIDSVHKTYTRTYYNSTLLQLCDGSLNGSGTGYVEPKHLILNVKDPTRYIRDEKNQYYAEWAKNNNYCYSYTIPKDLEKEKEREFIRQDLTKWLYLLGITVRKEWGMTDVLIMKSRPGAEKILKTKGGERVMELNENGIEKWVQNRSFLDFIWYLNHEVKNIPWIIDGTGFEKKFAVDIKLTVRSFEEIDEVNKQLLKYGLELVKRKKKMLMHIISEQENSASTTK